MTSSIKALGDICEFRYGKSLPNPVRRPGPFPVFGSNGVVGVHDEAITDGSTIIIGRKGSIGEINYSKGSCWPIDTTYFIDRSCSKVDLRWLAYRLKTLNLNLLNKAAAVPGLNRNDAYEKNVLVPPLDEQRRIAAMLDAADSLRAKRRAALAKLDHLARSIFIEMFGDAERAAWPVAEVSELAAPVSGAIRTGPFGSQLLHSEFVDEGIAVLGIDNVVSNEFRWAQRRFITEQKYADLQRYTVRPGDVLITIMGTCGRCAVAPDDIPVAINTKHLCCITLDREKCLPEFLHAYFLQHPLARRYLDQTAKGAIMAGLNMGIIKEMPVAIPPIDLQRDFVNRIASLKCLKDRYRAADRNQEVLFTSLQHRAFRGEL